MSESKQVRVIHKVRAYIDGVTYDPGQEATIAEHHYNESVHTLCEAETLTPPAASAPDSTTSAASDAAGSESSGSDPAA